AARRLPRYHGAGAALRARPGRLGLRAGAHPAALRRHLRGHADRRHRRQHRFGRGAALHRSRAAQAAMNFTQAELKKLALPLFISLVLIGAGVALIRIADASLAKEKGLLAAARAQRTQNAERLARIAEEEREVKEKLDVYQQLKSLNVLGEERRREGADAIARIR